MKNPIFRGVGESQKNQYIGGNCLKRRRAGTVCRFKEGLGKKRGGGVFEGVGSWYSNAQYVEACNFIKKETQALVFSCEVCGFFKNTFFYRTSLVTASENWILNEKFHGRSLGLNRPLQDIAQNLDDDFIMITLTSSSWHRGKISLNMLHTGGLCGVLGFTEPL